MVEGGHRCEAAARTLQGYQLGDTIPLEQKAFDVSSKNTLFRPIQTQVFYCQDDDVKLDGTVLKFLRDKSEEIADQKNLIIQPGWDSFFDKVFLDINAHDLLQAKLFENADDFFAESVNYRGMSRVYLTSNQIKKDLHEILTKAIFNYSPCKELIDTYEEKRKPKIENWKGKSEKWETLSADPYHIVSK